jgi:hypothetical protein
MHTVVLPAARLLLTSALVAWMILGFTRRPGRWMRWRMFTRGLFVIVHLIGTTPDGRTETVSPYLYSPGSFLLSPARLQVILTHLVRSGRYTRIDGHGRVLTADGEHPLEVKASHVVL